MNRSSRTIAFLLGLVAVMQAASENRPLFPAISIELIAAERAADYAACAARINETMKAKHGVAQFLRVYAGEATGDGLGGAFVLSPAVSFTVLTKNEQTFSNDPDLAELRARLHAIHSPGPRTLLKAARFDGTNLPGWLYNTQVAVSDETGYLKAIEQLRTLFDQHDFKDARINVFRVIAGRTTYTHLVSINTPSAERLAMLLDAIATTPWATEWIAASARFRTVIRNGTFCELVR